MWRLSAACWVAVVSAGRAANVEPVTRLIGDATWYVPTAEADTYRQAGARVHAVAPGALCQARNAALGDAFEQDQWCLQVSDDVRALRQVTDLFARDVSTRAIGVDEAAQVMRRAMLTHGARLAGVRWAEPPAVTAGALGRPVHPRARVTGDLFLVRPCDLRFDERLQVYEDLDYSLQHIGRFGFALRLETLLLDAQHRTNTGGCQTYRTTATERQAADYLLRKWPDWLVRDPKHAERVRFKLPRLETARQ